MNKQALKPFDPDRKFTKEELRQQVTTYITYLRKMAEPDDVIRARANTLREGLELYEDIEDEVKGEIHETDLGNAMRLSRLHGGDIRFCHAWRKWLIWDGRRWKIDDRGRIRGKAKDTIFKIYRELEKCPDKKSRERLFSHGIKSEGDQRIKAMLSLAESEPGISLIPEEFDKNPWALNCDN